MIKISVKGIDEVRAFLARLGAEAKHVTEGAVTEYLIGDETHGLKHYPPYKYLGTSEEGAYKKVYGGFFSDRQRRYVMAMIREGQIIPGQSSSNRYMGDAWHAEDKGRYWVAMNDVAHTKYVVGDTDQSRMMEMKGWDKISKNIKNNLKDAFRYAKEQVKQWLKENYR